MLSGLQRGTVLVAVAFALAGGACSAPATESAAADTATRFLVAVAADDGAAACAALTPDAVAAIESLRPEGCAEALPTLDLPDGTAGATQVWGDAAQVRTDSDVLFLREGPAGWLVAAAGCEPPETSGGPYECTVDGS